VHQLIQISPELSRKVSTSISNQKPTKRTDQKGEKNQEQKLQKSFGSFAAAGKNGDFSNL